MSEPTTWTIRDARNAGEKPNPHGGTLIKWYLDLYSEKESYEDVYCQKKPGNDLAAGQEIYGRVEIGEYGPRFHSEQDPSKKPRGGGAATSTRSDKEYGWQTNPIDAKRMNRAHAQEMALRFFHTLHRDSSQFTGSRHVSVLQEALPDLIDWFERDVEGAVVSPEENAAELAQALSQPPSQRQEANGPVTKDELTEAYTAFLDRAGEKGSPDREKAKKNVELRLAALGITDQNSMSSNQTRELMTFLTNG